ncbi:Hypothetical predicted protein, partial [Pelobates cultripes]
VRFHMTALIKERALSVGTELPGCIMASSPVRVAKVSLNAASATSECIDAVGTKTVLCRASSGTVASIADYSSAFRWG